jgi:hypothetical protein
MIGGFCRMALITSGTPVRAGSERSSAASGKSVTRMQAMRAMVDATVRRGRREAGLARAAHGLLGA